MVESTFQLGAGLGPRRERLLWRAGIARWDDLPSPAATEAAAALGLPARAHAALCAGVSAARAAFARRDAAALAALLPPGERWRMFPAFADDAVYLDIETGDDVVGFEGISAIGLLDRDGPRVLLAGRDLHLFPEVARGRAALVTFNGLSFDVPILRRAFRDWEPPACHIDLRHVLARAGHERGLKAIEAEVGIGRPDHLRGIGGWDAAWLWRRGREGDRAALRLFCEYNLYDVINLRTLMPLAYNALVAQLADEHDAPAVRDAAPPLDVPGRGDVLYDVSKILLAL